MDTPTRPHEQGASTADKAKAQAADAAQEAKARASDLAGQAQEQAKDRLGQQKQQAAGQLDGVSEALHQASDTLRDQEQGALAGYVDDAARQVGQLSNYLQSRSVGELIEEAQHYARREPALFLGGAALLGMLGARFLQSSSPRRSRSDRSYDSYSSSGRPRRMGSRPRGYRPVHGTAGGEMPDPARPRPTSGPMTGTPASDLSSPSDISMTSTPGAAKRREGGGGA